MHQLLVDSHCHLDHKRFGADLALVIQRAKEAGLSHVITAGLDAETNRKNIEIARQYGDFVKVALGMYPTEVKNVLDSQKEIEWIEQRSDKIIAIGEVGLDFHWSKDNEKDQLTVFRMMIQLAKKIDKPIVVHSRKAEKEALEILFEEKAKRVLLHCFSGDKGLVKKARDSGYFFSIPTSIVHSQHFQEMASFLPISQLLVETDSPFLSPFQAKRNEPSYVIEAAKRIAEIKKIDLQEAINIMYVNYQRLFL